MFSHTTFSSLQTTAAFAPKIGYTDYCGNSARLGEQREKCKDPLQRCQQPAIPNHSGW